MDWLFNTLLEAFVFVMQALFGGVAKAIFDALTALMTVPETILNNPAAVNLREISATAAWIFLPVLIAGYSLSIMLRRSEGSNELPWVDLVRAAIMSAVAMASTTWIIETLIKLNGIFIGGVQELGLDFKKFGVFFGLSGPNGIGAGMLLLWIIFLVGAAILVVQRAIVLAELAIYAVLGPLIALGLAHPGGNGGAAFRTWCVETASVTLTGAMQTAVLYLMMANLGDAPDVNGYLMVLGSLFVMLKGPQVLRTFLYSAGVGGMATGVAGEATRWVVMRRLAQAAVRAPVPPKGP